jgi:integrase
MASIHRDPRGKSPYWYVAFRSPDGKRRFQSTRETERKAALVFCRTIVERGVREAKSGRLTSEAKALELLSEFREQVTGQPLHNHTVRRWFEQWLTMKSRVRAGKTLDRYRQVVRDFLSSLGPRGDLSLAHLNSDDILRYRDWVTEMGRSPRTANLSVKVVSAALNAAYRQGYIAANPALALESLPVKAEERGTFTPGEVAKLARAAEGDWNGAILLAYYTGGRLSDIANMQWSAIDWKAKTLRFIPGKTGKPIMIPLHPQLERELRKHPGIGKAPMFPTLAGRGTGGAHGLTGEFKEIMVKAGVEGKPLPAAGGRTLSSLSFHSLRHSFNSALANAAVPTGGPAKIDRSFNGRSEQDLHPPRASHAASGD